MSRLIFPAPFERLRRDEINGGYTKELEHKGHEIQVRFRAETDDELRVLLPAAQAFWKSRLRWFKGFREYAATELLGTLNANLDRGPGDFKPVTATQVRNLLPAPFAVTFEVLESGCVYFQMDGGTDEDLLQENCFEVGGTLEGGITDGDVVTLL